MTAGQQYSFAPAAVMEAMKRGDFREIMGNQNPKENEPEIEDLFKQIIITMAKRNITFAQSVATIMGANKSATFVALLNITYHGHCAFINSGADDYLKLTGLKLDLNNLLSNKTTSAAFAFYPLTRLEKGKVYYWRVRARYKDVTLSTWSKVNHFKT